MLDKIQKLQESREELYTRAQATLDTVEGSTDPQAIQTAHKEFDDLMSQYDDAGDQISRMQKLVDAQNEKLAAEEARKQVEPRNTPHDGNVIESRDGAPTEDERRRRTDIIQRHYVKGEKISEEDLILANKRFPEERVFFKALLRGKDSLTDEERKSIKVVGISGVPTDLRAFPIDAAAQSSDAWGNTATDADGGYLVPEQFQARVIQTMKDYSGLLDAGVVNMIATPTGAEMQFPTNDDTANEAELVSEGGVATFGELTWGTISVNAHKFSTKAFPMSAELLQDAEINIEAFLREAMATRLGRALEKYFTTGSGSGQPEGLVNKLEGVTARQISAASANWGDHRVYNILLDLEHHVDKAYRTNQRWMLNDAVLKALRKVKDADNQYIWQRSVQDGVPSTLLGRPYFTNAHMDSTLTANDYPVAIGDFSNFLVRTTRTLNIRRLDELGALTDQSIFVGFARYDSKVMDQNAFALGKAT